MGNVTHYARVWLNISAEIRTFLEERKLQNRILWLQQVGEKTGEGANGWNVKDGKTRMCEAAAEERMCSKGSFAIE